ncbi:MAG: peptide deformylase [Sneathiellales bacterium]|nr:peptide deformylase [Sneathiellales bacterium]
MAVKSIVKMGNPVLLKPAAPVTDIRAPEIRHLIQDMFDSLEAVGGVGLAAPQIAVGLQVVIVKIPRARMALEENRNAGEVGPKVLINPIVEGIGEANQLGWEGCLSVPGLRGLVPRFSSVHLKARDQEGQEIDQVIDGFYARVLQHECDHLSGILYPQRMTDLKLLVYEEEMNSFMEYYSSVDGDV